MNLADLLIRSSASHPERIALKLDAVELSYTRLDAATRYAAGYLADCGVRAGDRVALMLPNVAHWPIIYFGILRAGAVAVPMDPLLTAGEIAHRFDASGAAISFIWSSFLEEAAAGAEQVGAQIVSVDQATFPDLVLTADPVSEVVDRASDDTAVLLYTSGATGHPEGTELTHAGLVRDAELVADELLHLTPDDVVFGGLPLSDVTGQTCGLNASVAAGSTLTLLTRFDPTAAMTVLDRDRVSVFQGVPTMFDALLRHPHREQFDLSALRVCVSRGAVLPVEVMTEFEKVFDCVVRS